MKTPVHTVLFVLSNDGFQHAHTIYTKVHPYFLPFCSRPVFTYILDRENTQCPLLDSIIPPFTNDEGQTSKKRQWVVVNKMNVIKES